MIVVHQLLDFIEPLLLPLRVVAIPTGVAGFGREMIEVLPLRIGAVIRHPGMRAVLVRAVAALEPREARAEVLGDAELQAVFGGGLPPLADDVAVRTHVDGVPIVQFRVPEEEVVVMHAHADEIFRAGFLIEPHQAVGVPLFRLPERDDVLVTELRGMAVVFEVIAVTFAAGFIHVARIPIAFHRHRLRPPVRPDAELRVAEPIGAAVGFQRSHVRLIRPVGGGRARGERRGC